MNKHLAFAKKIKKIVKAIGVLFIVTLILMFLLPNFARFVDNCRYGRSATRYYLSKHEAQFQLIVDWMLTTADDFNAVNSDNAVALIKNDLSLTEDEKETLLSAIEVLFGDKKNWSIEKGKYYDYVTFTYWYSERIEAYGGITYFQQKSEFDYLGRDYKRIGNSDWYYYRVNYHNRGYIE